jgi:hypothetical protein
MKNRLFQPSCYLRLSFPGLLVDSLALVLSSTACESAARRCIWRPKFFQNSRSPVAFAVADVSER